MKTKSPFSHAEALVDGVLNRKLRDSGYRVFASVRLSDILSKEPGERLASAEFDFFTRSHIDFVIATDERLPQPVFGIEFDGPHHSEHRQQERDVLKNRLCYKAGFPLLRIGAECLRPSDETNLLSFMLDRFLSWENEYPLILRHIEQITQDVAPELLANWIEDWDPVLDPHFHFDCAHPFPALSGLVDKLKSLGVAFSPQEVRSETRFIASGGLVHMNCAKDDQFWGVRHRVSVRDLSTTNQEVVIEVIREASVRSWLPLESSVPSRIPSLMEATSTRELEEIGVLWERRLKGMWFPTIPGITASGIAETFAEYLALRAAEEQLQTLMTRNKGISYINPTLTGDLSAGILTGGPAQRLRG